MHSSCSDNGIGIAPELLRARVRPVRPGRAHARPLAGRPGPRPGAGQEPGRAARRPRRLPQRGPGQGQHLHRRSCRAWPATMRRRRAARPAGARRSSGAQLDILVVDDNADAAHAARCCSSNGATRCGSSTTAVRALTARAPGAGRRAARHRPARHGRQRTGAPPAQPSRRAPAPRLVALTGYGQDARPPARAGRRLRPPPGQAGRHDRAGRPSSDGPPRAVSLRCNRVVQNLCYGCRL